MGRRSKRPRRAAGPQAATPDATDAGTPAAEAGPAPVVPRAPLADAGMRQATSSVQDMHRAIATSAFDAVQGLPMLSLPSRIAQGVHDALSEAMYAGVRQSLQAVVGDALNGAHPMAIGMRMLVDDADVLGRAPLLQSLGRRVVVFVHGLGADERSWSRPHPDWEASAWAGRGTNYGDLLRHDEGLSPVFVRYNTGVSIEENGHQLSARLDELVKTAPQIERLVIIGHSMGGLVARSAFERAGVEGAAWPEKTALIICLGSPQHGAPLEQLGRLTSAALAASPITRPPASGAASRGARVRGRGAAPPKSAAHAAVPLRHVWANLTDESHGMAGDLVGHWLGDGLVPRHGTHDAHPAGAANQVELDGLGHMALLHHPRVYVLIRDWIRAALVQA